MTTAPASLVTLAALAAAASGAVAADARLEPWPASADTPPAAWHFAGLPRQRAPQTRFSVAGVDGRRALRIEAESSYGNLVHPLPADAKPKTLAWSWKMERLNDAGDLRQRSGDDTPAKVCVLFDMAIEKLSFVERQKLSVARSLSTEPVPAATICYVWDGGKLPVGTDIVNAFTTRQRYLVLRSGPSQVGQWVRERRDLEADFKKLYGSESAEMPPVAAVAVGADADNTKGQSVAWIGEIALEP